MNIKTILPLAAILGCIVNNTFAMEVVKLDPFWQKVQNGEISHDKAKFKLELEISKLKHYKKTDSITQEVLSTEMEKLFTQAGHAGVYPYTLDL